MIWSVVQVLCIFRAECVCKVTMNLKTKNRELRTKNRFTLVKTPLVGLLRRVFGVIDFRLFETLIHLDHKKSIIFCLLFFVFYLPIFLSSILSGADVTNSFGDTLDSKFVVRHCDLG